MTLARAVVLATLFLAPLAVGQGNYDFRIERVEDRAAPPGSSFDVTVALAHTCPATGAVRVVTRGDASITLTPGPATWGECGSDGYARTTAAVRVEVLENATAGYHALGIAALWRADSGPPHSASTGFGVTVPYLGTVTLSGPSSSVLVPGSASSLTLEVDVDANADTRLVFRTDAPEDWTVFGAQAVDVRVVNGSGRLTHTFRFTPTGDAYGDVLVTIAASPSDALTRQEAGAAGTHRWTARLPPRVRADPPPEVTPPPGDAPRDGADVAPQLPSEVDEGLPAWAVAAGLIALGAGAFWWTRRK